MYRNETTGRRYTFVAPDSLDGPDVVMVPFPAAALRRPTADGIIGHDCNPCIVPVTANDPKAELRAIPQGIQPASMLIVENETDKPVTVSGIPCYPGDTVMMYIGGTDRYVRLGGAAPWVNPTETAPKPEESTAVDASEAAKAPETVEPSEATKAEPSTEAKAPKADPTKTNK